MNAEDLLNTLSANRMNVTLASQRRNYCPTCDSPMQSSSEGYFCAGCGETQESEGGELYKDYDNIAVCNIKIGTGANKGRFYNTGGDPSAQQKKAIYNRLIMCQRKQANSQFTIPIDILESTATIYNTMQKLTVDTENGGKKKCFVHRKTVKDEVLAAIIYFECVRAGLIRKKADVARFMNLNVSGFARGEDIVRDLKAKGQINLEIDEESAVGFAKRYLRVLKIDDKYSKFIDEIVRVADTHKISMSSQLSSKVVGAIWLLITQCKMNISSADVEKSTDNTKKNTFGKFTNAVLMNMHLFKHVFEEHGVPMF